MIEKLQGLKIFLILIWEEDENDYSYLLHLFKCLISLFEGSPQNRYIQKATFDFFISNPNSEIFFSKINTIIKQAISQNRSNKTSSKPLQKLLFEIMRLFQLFCEGHNAELQSYLSNQSNSKNSYDMINLIANLATSYLISDENYKIIDQCFDTLSEFIQVIFCQFFEFSPIFVIFPIFPSFFQFSLIFSISVIFLNIFSFHVISLYFFYKFS